MAKKPPRIYYQYGHVTNLPSAGGPALVRSQGGLVQMNVTGLAEARGTIHAMPERVSSTLLKDADARATRIQLRLQTEASAAYNKSATGRFARSLHARAQKVGTAGGGVSTVVRVTMQNYRESRFLTNAGGGGYFKSYPVEPYRIHAEGVEDSLGFAQFMGLRQQGKFGRKGSSKILSILRSGVGRLKVPRASAFFVAGRRPGRGGGESREIHDAIGAGGDDPKGSFFFYPLWVNHPGFPRDVVSDVILDEGGKFLASEVALVKAAHMVDGRIGVSRDIPVTNPQVSKSRS